MDAVAAFIGAVAIGTPIGAAQAKGCLEGAAVGGVAGHMAGHHGLLGAGVGCAVGHHEASKNAQAHNNRPRMTVVTAPDRTD